ncbi:MAG: hypothetical protein OCC45_00230 [Desulfotalea sp.]
MAERFEAEQYDDLTVGLGDFEDDLYVDDWDLLKPQKQDSPLATLKSIVVGLDWEITDENLFALNEEVVSLRQDFISDKIALVYLQALEQLSKYIYQKKSNAIPDAIKLLPLFFRNFENIVSEHITEQTEIKDILRKDVERFEKLKREIIKYKENKTPDKDFQKNNILLKLKEIVLSIDWQLTEEDLEQLKVEASQLEVEFTDSRPARILLQGIGVIANYIQNKGSKANVGSFTLLYDFFDTLEKIVVKELPADTEKELLLVEINKFEKFKATISIEIVEKVTPIGLTESPKEVVTPNNTNIEKKDDLLSSPVVSLSDIGGDLDDDKVPDSDTKEEISTRVDAVLGTDLDTKIFEGIDPLAGVDVEKDDDDFDEEEAELAGASLSGDIAGLSDGNQSPIEEPLGVLFDDEDTTELEQSLSFLDEDEDEKYDELLTPPVESGIPKISDEELSDNSLEDSLSFLDEDEANESVDVVGDLEDSLRAFDDDASNSTEDIREIDENLGSLMEGELGSDLFEGRDPLAGINVESEADEDIEDESELDGASLFGEIAGISEDGNEDSDNLTEEIEATLGQDDSDLDLEQSLSFLDEDFAESEEKPKALAVDGFSDTLDSSLNDSLSFLDEPIQSDESLSSAQVGNLIEEVIAKPDSLIEEKEEPVDEGVSEVLSRVDEVLGGSLAETTLAGIDPLAGVDVETEADEFDEDEANAEGASLIGEIAGLSDTESSEDLMSEQAGSDSDTLFADDVNRPLDDLETSLNSLDDDPLSDVVPALSDNIAALSDMDTFSSEEVVDLDGDLESALNFLDDEDDVLDETDSDIDLDSALSFLDVDELDIVSHDSSSVETEVEFFAVEESDEKESAIIEDDLEDELVTNISFDDETKPEDIDHAFDSIFEDATTDEEDSVDLEDFFGDTEKLQEDAQVVEDPNPLSDFFDVDVLAEESVIGVKIFVNAKGEEIVQTAINGGENETPDVEIEDEPVISKVVIVPVKTGLADVSGYTVEELLKSLQGSVSSLGCNFTDEIVATVLNDIELLREKNISSGELYLQLMQFVAEHIQQYGYGCHGQAYPILEELCEGVSSYSILSSEEAQQKFMLLMAKTLAWQQSYVASVGVVETSKVDIDIETMVDKSESFTEEETKDTVVDVNSLKHEVQELRKAIQGDISRLREDILAGK